MEETKSERLRKAGLSHLSEFKYESYINARVVVEFALLSSLTQTFPRRRRNFIFMSFALPARQITFGRTNVAQQQPYQFQQPQQHGLALPGGSTYAPSHQQPQPSNGLSLPAPAPYITPQIQPKPPSPLSSVAQATSNAVAGPSSSTTPPVASTPAPLTLEQQHITAVEGIVPTLQNIVATVNLDCRLDLKTIALHARNAEYNPKVGSQMFSEA